MRSPVAAFALAIAAACSGYAFAADQSPQPLARADCEKAGMNWNDRANVCGSNAAANPDLRPCERQMLSGASSRPWTSAGGAVASTAVNASIIVYWCIAPAGTNQEFSGLETYRLPFEIEPCSTRDYIPYRLVVPPCRSFEFGPWFQTPEAHRNTLACNKILLTHFTTGGRSGFHLLDRCVWHGHHLTIYIASCEPNAQPGIPQLIPQPCSRALPPDRAL